MDDLLQAYDEKDDAKFKELLKNYLNHAVDNEVINRVKISKFQDSQVRMALFWDIRR